MGNPHAVMLVDDVTPHRHTLRLLSNTRASPGG
jgi:diaminopimelate epimerase